MLALAPSTSTTNPSVPKSKHLTPNLLPCAIHHSGPIPTPRRYWSPVTTTTTSRAETAGVTKTQTSYLRGRKLAGRSLRVPEGYVGLVLQKTDKLLPVKTRVPSAEELRAVEEGDAEDEAGMAAGEEEARVNTLETRAEFSELVIWDHEAVPEDEDAYVRGIEEWVEFAKAVRLPMLTCQGGGC